MSSTPKERVVADLTEALEKLQGFETQEELLKPLRSQFSTDSLDSGLCSKGVSRNTSSDKLLGLNLPLGDLVEQASEEEPVKLKRPEIRIQRENSLPKEITRKTSSPDVSRLGASLMRNNSVSSTASSVSEEYLTPPTSPVLTISRSIPLDPPSSPALPLQEIEIEVRINTRASKEVIKVQTRAVIHNKMEQFQLNLFFHPSTDTKQRKRSRSSPCSPPASPTLSSKNHSQSFDEDSPQESPYLVKHHGYSTVAKSNLIEKLLRKNMEEFVKNTDLEALYPCLYSAELISRKDLEELKATKTTRSRNMFFYMFLLGSKGADAYKRLFDCLKKEREHLGHEDLVRIINKGLIRHMF